MSNKSKFWVNQSVLHSSNSTIIDNDGPINEHINIPNKPILPKGYIWTTYDMTNMDHCIKVSKFLEKYYVEDVDNEFRLCYSPEFLQWALTSPRCKNKDKTKYNLCFGVEVKKTGVIVGFISGIPIKHRINSDVLDTVEINFLCVHKKLRNKRLAEIMFIEMKRRGRIHDYLYSFYTTSKKIHKSFYIAQYHYRILNVHKCISTGYSILEKGLNMNTMVNKYDLSKEISSNIIKMEKKHLQQTYKHLNTYLMQYMFYPIYTFAEFKHIFYNNDHVRSYVIENNKGNVVDFISYYICPTKVLKNNKKSKSKYNTLRIANLYYYTSFNTSLVILINDLMILAKNDGIDSLTAIDIMENKTVFYKLGFKLGTGYSHYNMYNWKTNTLKSNQIGKMII